MGSRRRSAFGGMLAERVADPDPVSKADPESVATASTPEPLKPEAVHKKNACKPLWQVIGGERYGGLLVRLGQELGSAVATGRLTTGSVVEEMSLQGDRLCYYRLTGSGPNQGWITIALNDKILAERISEMPRSSSHIPSSFSAAVNAAALRYGADIDERPLPALEDAAAPVTRVASLPTQGPSVVSVLDMGTLATQAAPAEHVQTAEGAAEEVAEVKSLWLRRLERRSGGPTESLGAADAQSTQAVPAEPIEKSNKISADTMPAPAVATQAVEVQVLAAGSDAAQGGRSSTTLSQKPHDIELEYSFQLPSIDGNTLNELADMTAKEAGISVLRRHSLVSESSQSTTAAPTEPVAVFCFSPPSSPQNSEDLDRASEDADEYDFDSFNVQSGNHDHKADDLSPSRKMMCAESISPSRVRTRGGA